jgi:arylsulfatase
MTQPNILVLMSDQHRADAIGCASDGAVESPNMDRLAQEGIRFGRTYCQGPLCMPARASFLTGKYVREHGVFDNNRELEPDTPTFLHDLSEQGYHNVCFGKMHLYVQPGVTDVRQRAETMQGLGFDELHETGGKGASVRMRSEFTEDLESRELFDPYRDHYRSMRGQPAWATIPFTLPLEVYPDLWMGNRAANWIDHYDRDQPFFAWVGFPGPHSPWDTPLSYVERYSGTELIIPQTGRPDPGDSEAYAKFMAPRLRDSDSETLTAERIAAVRRAYFGNVTAIDDAVGYVLSALERRGMLDNTLIVYTTDHGEMLGEHGLLAKRVFYEPSVRVPLIIRPPGGGAELVEMQIAQHIDVTATILQAAGANQMEGTHGRPLLAQPTPLEAAFSENLGMATAVGDRWKIVAHEETAAAVALFDLRRDPLENENLVASTEHSDIRDELMRGPVTELLARPTVWRPDARPEGRGGHDD